MAVNWNPADKGSELILSNSNLSARCPSGSVSRSSVRANISKSTGKWYFEIINLDGGAFHRIGWSTDLALAAGDLNTNLPYTIYAGVGWNMSQTLDRWELSNITHGVSAATANAVVMTAIDLTSGGKVWFGKDGVWFSGDPATGTSPADSWAGTANFLPFISVSASALTNPQVTGRFKTEDFSYAVPAGFSALEESVPAGIYTHTHALLLGGGADWDDDDLKIALLNDQYVFNAAHTEYADIADTVMSDPSYESLSLSGAMTGDIGLDANDARFTGLYGSAAAMALYKNATVGSLDRPLLLYSALNALSTPLPFFGGAFRVRWGGNGLLILN
jgi:hypothetical protein